MVVNAVAVAAPVIVGAVQVKLKSSIAVTGLLPEPEVPDLVAIRIQTGPELLLSAVPKFTVTAVEPHVPRVVVSDEGEVVAFTKLVGEEPKP